MFKAFLMVHKEISSINVIPVIILNWNGWDDTFICVDSVLKSGERCTIWVVDNGSTEDRSEKLLGSYPMIELIRLDSNFGWSGGYNRALDIAHKRGHKYAYLLNNDTKVAPFFLTKTLEFMDAKTAAVGSQILSFDGKYVSFDGKYHDSKPYNLRSGSETVELINGCGVLVSIEAFNLVGKFDEQYFCYDEETEWSERAGKICSKVLKVSFESNVFHLHKGSNINENTLYYKTRNAFVKTAVRRPYQPALFDFFHKQIQVFRFTHNKEAINAMLCALQDAFSSKFGIRTTVRAGVGVKIVSLLYRFEFTQSMGFLFYRLSVKLLKS